MLSGKNYATNLFSKMALAVEMVVLFLLSGSSTLDTISELTCVLLAYRKVISQECNS